jgi:hypothetical protein
LLSNIYAAVPAKSLLTGVLIDQTAGPQNPFLTENPSNHHNSILAITGCYVYYMYATSSRQAQHVVGILLKTCGLPVENVKQFRALVVLDTYAVTTGST